MSVLLAVCGLGIEARIAASPLVRTLASGGDVAGLPETLRRRLDADVVAIISFGVAGALDPTLRAGTLVVPETIVDGDRRWAVDARWMRALVTSIPDATTATLAGSDTLVDDPAAKARLHGKSDACAVDMESHIAARIACERGLPFVALRAISDPADRRLPPAAAIAMRPDGRVAVGAVMASVLRTPSQLPGLVRLGLETQAALRSLRRSRRRLGGRLGYPDLDELLIDVV